MKRQGIKKSCLMIALVGCSIAATADAAGIENQQGVLDGKYISTAADCVACHTAKGGAAFAGGYAIDSPMGTIWSTNITPSKKFGIGEYTEAEFARAVREGVARDGHHLYPAMPYTSYGKMTDEDIAALYKYFMTQVQPVDTPNKETKLPFPFSVRASMGVWNLIYGDSKPFVPAGDQSAEINRGNYLVNSLAHCAECHTPRTALMGLDSSKPLAGSPLGPWYAPNITSDKLAGIGAWTNDELKAYLKTGHVAGKAQAAGPMAEAVEHSLQHLSDADLNAIVAYLKQTKPIAAEGEKSRDTFGAPSDSETRLRGNAVRDADPGWKVYTATCAACHGAKGEGTSVYPSLFHNTATGAAYPTNLVATILFGVHRTIDGHDIEMPGFGPQASYTERLTDQQVADVSNYVLTNFGQPQKKLTADDVAQARAGGPVAPLVKLSQYLLPVGIVVLLVLIVIAIAVSRRRRAHKKG
ncbi:cytochrome C [Bordetella sp. N]|nr:cytochrome C [Bordetella sp. N]